MGDPPAELIEIQDAGGVGNPLVQAEGCFRAGFLLVALESLVDVQVQCFPGLPGFRLVVQQVQVFHARQGKHPGGQGIRRRIR